MTHQREAFERVYALADRVAPARLLTERAGPEADRFLIKKEIAFAGLSRLNRTADAYFRGVPFSRALARGFAHLRTFLGAERIDVKAIRGPMLRSRIGAQEWPQAAIYSGNTSRTDR